MEVNGELCHQEVYSKKKLRRKLKQERESSNVGTSSIMLMMKLLLTWSRETFSNVKKKRKVGFLKVSQGLRLRHFHFKSLGFFQIKSFYWDKAKRLRWQELDKDLLRLTSLYMGLERLSVLNRCTVNMKIIWAVLDRHSTNLFLSILLKSQSKPLKSLKK